MTHDIPPNSTLGAPLFAPFAPETAVHKQQQPGHQNSSPDTRWFTIGKAVRQDEAAADVAIVYAVERDWLIAEGYPPHSIAITWEGITLLKRRGME
jgi:hypothetical protein